MKKLDLKEKVGVAWYKATASNPTLVETYGADGWEVWLNTVYKLTQEDIARLFDVALNTSQRWHKEFKEARS